MFKPKDGQAVSCPEDRGEAAYRGIVESSGETTQVSHQGHPFVWVTVRHPRGHACVWPSNRLAA